MNKTVLLIGGSTIVILGVYGIREHYRYKNLLHHFSNVRQIVFFKDQIIDELDSQCFNSHVLSDKLVNDIKAWSQLYLDDVI